MGRDGHGVIRGARSILTHRSLALLHRLHGLLLVLEKVTAPLPFEMFFLTVDLRGIVADDERGLEGVYGGRLVDLTLKAVVLQIDAHLRRRTMGDPRDVGNCFCDACRHLAAHKVSADLVPFGAPLIFSERRSPS